MPQEIAAPVETTTRLETPRFRLVEVEYCDANGASHRRDIIRHEGSVVILPLLEGDRVCLIRNFRASVGKWLIELPAGTSEKGEAPEVTARRELPEETGYQAAHWEKLTSIYPAPGILDEQMHLFVARQLSAGPPQREPGELIENLVVTWDEALQMIDEGAICDAKTLVGLLTYQRARTRDR